MNRPRISKLYNTRHNEKKLQDTIKRKSLRPCHWAVHQQHNIQILDDNWNVTHNIKLNNAYINMIKPLKNGRLLVHDPRWDQFRIWDVSNDHPQELADKNGRASVTQLSDGQLIFWVGHFRLILLNLDTNEQKEFNDQVDPVDGFIELSNKKVISFSCYEGRVLEWNPLNMTSFPVFHDNRERIRNVIELPDHRLAILCQFQLIIFDMDTKELRTFRPPDVVGPVNMILLTKNRLALWDSFRVYIFNIDSETWFNKLIFNIDSKTCFNKLTFHPNCLLQLSNGQLVIGSKWISIWDLETPEEVVRLNCRSKVTSLVETSDGSLIVACENGVIRKLDLQTKTFTDICQGFQICPLYLPDDQQQFQVNLQSLLDEHLITDIHGIVQNFLS